MDLRSARATVQHFGRQVRAYRKAAGITQIELSRLSRVTSKYISEIELGTSNPSLMTMVLVADELECSVAELLEERGRGKGR